MVLGLLSTVIRFVCNILSRSSGCPIAKGTVQFHRQVQGDMTTEQSEATFIQQPRAPVHADASDITTESALPPTARTIPKRKSYLLGKASNSNQISFRSENDLVTPVQIVSKHKGAAAAKIAALAAKTSDKRSSKSSSSEGRAHQATFTDCNHNTTSSSALRPGYVYCLPFHLIPVDLDEATSTAAASTACGGSGFSQSIAVPPVACSIAIYFVCCHGQQQDSRHMQLSPPYGSQKHRKHNEGKKHEKKSTVDDVANWQLLSVAPAKLKRAVIVPPCDPTPAACYRLWAQQRRITESRDQRRWASRSRTPQGHTGQPGHSATQPPSQLSRHGVSICVPAATATIEGPFIFITVQDCQLAPVSE